MQVNSIEINARERHNEIILLRPIAEMPCATVFLSKRKERKLQYQWYHNFRSYLAEKQGIEPKE